MRNFSPYEKNQLAKYGISETEALTKGEMPVEYITGHVPFFGLELDVTQDVLIPRIETEELVTKVVELVVAQAERQALPPGETFQLADVGTGSGAIGICVAQSLTAKKIPHTLTMSDVSAAAVAVAIKNWQRIIGIQTQIIVSDLLQSYPADSRFDLMVANLPYIPSSRIPVLDASVVEFEPHLALDGGPEGLTLIEKFLSQAESHLKPSGQILLEIDYTHAEDVLRLNSKYRGRVDHDAFGQPRFAILTLAP